MGIENFIHERTEALTAGTDAAEALALRRQYRDAAFEAAHFAIRAARFAGETREREVSPVSERVYLKKIITTSFVELEEGRHVALRRRDERRSGRPYPSFSRFRPKRFEVLVPVAGKHLTYATIGYHSDVIVYYDGAPESPLERDQEIIATIGKLGQRFSGAG